MSEMTIIPDLYLEGNSKQWKNWQAIYLDIKTCQDCRKNHGKNTTVMQSVTNRSICIADAPLYR